MNNQAEVHAYLTEQALETEQLWKKIEAKADYQIFREQLLARWQF